MRRFGNKDIFLQPGRWDNFISDEPFESINLLLNLSDSSVFDMEDCLQKNMHLEEACALRNTPSKDTCAS